MQEKTRPWSRSSVRVALRLPFGVAEVADYLFDREGDCSWLGSDSRLRADLSSFVQLPKSPAGCDDGDDSAVNQTGWVSQLVWPDMEDPRSSGTQEPDANGTPQLNGKFELVVTLHGPAGGSRVAFRISPCSNSQRRGKLRAEGMGKETPVSADNCQIRISQSGLETEGNRRHAAKTWQTVMDRIAGLMQVVGRNKRRERQAIIVVHGVGEQRPGQLLREFVKNVFEVNAGEAHFVKPDRLSSLFEMRMVTVPRTDGSRPTTDVYELYWAHLIRDTSLAQVYAWAWRLIWSKSESVPSALKTLVWTLRIGLGAAAVAAIWIASLDLSAWTKGPGIVAVVLLALPAIAKFALSYFNKEFVIGYAGDAARYLEPLAGNISRRQDIREAGADLLDTLHSKGRYSRIIVYGHSLGSVIAYDILSHAWSRLSRQREDVSRTSSRALRAIENLLNPHGPVKPPNVDEIQKMQHSAWREYRRNGFRWRVSDLVTAGSPLAHASWLLHLDSKTRFDDLKQERTLPTCPPQTEKKKGPGPRDKPRCRNVFTFTHAYDAPNRPSDDPDHVKPKFSVQVPHHAGLFALTRWTNVYFPYHGIYKGDPVAGPLKDLFGEWIKDVKLRAPDRFAHTLYTHRASEPNAVEKLRLALNLPMRRPLADYAKPTVSPQTD